MIENQVKLFKALADNSRLKILSTLMEQPMYVELLSERLELAPSTVSFHLKKLEDAGLVTKVKDQYYIIYSIQKDLLEKPLGSFIGSKGQDEESERELIYRQKVIDSFIKFNQIKTIPVQRKKRLIILEYLLQAFEYEKTYSEKEVNLIIADYHEDFATLRRELINEKLMKRENGVYWRLK